ncbi:MAG: hypothetical protein NTW86_32405 [Candidatus Sumerlaeota bacterium]|nr:hypothetical protein [Candidatus Sumerlaeota bacterium]
MKPTAQSKVTFPSEQTIRFDAGLSLSELYAQLDGRELLVEPLSARQPIREFVAEGGLGFGAASNGSFAASICRVKTGQFEYGSEHQTLYNVGYPLHRLVEGARQSKTRDLLNLPSPPGRGQGEGAWRADEWIENLTVYVRPRQERVAVFRPTEVDRIEAPAEATDVFYVNAAGARLFDLDGPGLVAVFPKDLAPDEAPAPAVWDKRFIEDALPKDHGVLKALVQPSLLAKSADLLAPLAGVLFVLFVRLGLLLLATGEAEALKRAESEILSAPLAWRLSGARW